MSLLPSQNVRPYRWLPFLLVVMAAGALLIGAVALRHVETALVAGAGESLALAAIDIAGQLDLLLAGQYGDIQMMAQAWVFHEQDRAAMAAYLQALQETSPMYLWLGATDARGRIVAATEPRTVGQDRSGSLWFQAVRSRGLVNVRDAEATEESDGVLAVAFTAPIAGSHGEFLGAVSSRVGLPVLEDVLARTVTALQAQHGTSGKIEYQFLARDGALIADSTLREELQVNLKQLGLPSAMLYDAGPPGFIEEDHPRRRVRVVTGYAQTKGAGAFSGVRWGILVRMDRDDILAPIALIVRRVGTAGALIVLPLFGLLLWATGRLQTEWVRAQEERGHVSAAETKFQTLLESAPDAIVIAATDGRIALINRQAETLFGYPPDELIGRPIEILLPERYRERHVWQRDHYCAAPQIRPMGGAADLVARRKDGTECPVEISLSPVETEEETSIVAVIRDTTARRRMEKRQAAQLAVSHVLAESVTLNDAAPRLLRTICETIGWELGEIWLVDRHCHALRCEALWHTPSADVSEFVAASRLIVFPAGIGLPGRVWASGEPAWIPDVLQDANFPRAPMAARGGLHGAFSFPIKGRADVIGVIEFFSREIRRPDDDLLRMMGDIGLKIGAFVERAGAEEEQKRLAKDIRLLLESTRGGIYGLDCRGRCTFINRAGAALLGYEPEELLGRPMHEVIHHTRSDGSPYPVEACPAYRILQGGAGSRMDDDVLWRKDGASFPAGYSCSPIVEEGTVQGAVVTFADITEAKRAQEEVRRAKEKAEKAVKEKTSILASVNAFFIGLDKQGIVTEWTLTAELMLGIPAGVALGRPFWSLPITWDWPQLRHSVDRCLGSFKNVTLDNFSLDFPHGRAYRGCEWLTNVTQENGPPDDSREEAREEVREEAREEAMDLRLAISPINLSMTVSPVLDDHSAGVVIMGEDVTNRRRLERELAQAQKWESIGQLAAGIAHEINTPTQYIGDNVRFLRDSFADLATLLDQVPTLVAAVKAGTLPARLAAELDEVSRRIDLGYLTDEIPKAIRQSLEGIERVATIVRAMKEFAHPDTGEKTLVDLNKAVQSTSVVARNEWKYVADLVTDLDPDLPPAPCLPGAFNQVVLNLIINAAHAVADVVGKEGGKGVITVSSRRVGEWAEIRVRDTGTGIPEAIRGRIFDPFFTTKGVGKGTGQGLAIARSVIVDKHRGTLTFETEAGKGTTFIIRLPLEDSR